MRGVRSTATIFNLPAEPQLICLVRLLQLSQSLNSRLKNAGLQHYVYEIRPAGRLDLQMAGACALARTQPCGAIRGFAVGLVLAVFLFLSAFPARCCKVGLGLSSDTLGRNKVLALVVEAVARRGKCMLKFHNPLTTPTLTTEHLVLSNSAYMMSRRILSRRVRKCDLLCSRLQRTWGHLVGVFGEVRLASS